MRIKPILFPVAAAAMLLFGCYGCGSASQEPAVEQTGHTEKEPDTEEPAAETEAVEEKAEEKLPGNPLPEGYGTPDDPSKNDLGSEFDPNEELPDSLKGGNFY